MLGALLACGVIVIASAAVGAALRRLCGGAIDPWLSPAVGFATLLAVCAALIRAPGHATTTVVVVVVLVVAAAAYARADLLRVPPWDVCLVVVLVVLAGLIPFLVNDRFGLLGVSFNNDTRFHLWGAEYFRAGLAVPTSVFPRGYPLGPHALVATFSHGTGLSVDKGFVGLLLAVPVLTTMTALAGCGLRAWWRRGLLALAVGGGYLLAAYYGQAAFKETMEALFVLAFALGLRDLARARRLAVGAAVPLAALLAGSVVTYSYIGLAWPALTMALWLAAELVVGGWYRRPAAIVARVRGLAWMLVLAGAVLVVGVAAELSEIFTFYDSVSFSAAGSGTIASTNLGNLAGPLSPFEALGIWPAQDFRFAPGNGFHAGLLSAVALGVAVYGVLWSLRRRELTVPAAIAAAIAVYLKTRHGESVYVAAKALVILTPLVILVGARALLEPGWWPSPELSLVRVAVAVVFFGGLGWSSFLSLKSAQVAPSQHQDELIGLRPLVRGQNVLFLGYDDYIGWRLFGATVTAPPVQSPVPFTLRMQKPYNPGDALDFDSLTAASLDGYAFVVTSRTDYASVPPANFKLVRTLASYLVWRRDGPTPDHRVLTEGAAPGAELDCATSAGRAVSEQAGRALVRPTPVVTQGPGGVGAGASVVERLTLPAGRWRLSLQYASPQRLRLSAPGLRTSLPANLDRMGLFWPAGTLTTTASRTTVELTVAVDKPAAFSARSQFATLGQLAATRDAPNATVALGQACGRYVDQYTVG